MKICQKPNGLQMFDTNFKEFEPWIKIIIIFCFVYIDQSCRSKRKSLNCFQMKIIGMCISLQAHIEYIQNVIHTFVFVILGRA
jgi:hypothetical protein